MTLKQVDQIRNALEELGQAYLFRKSEIKENKPIALVKAYSNKEGNLELRLHKTAKTFSINASDTDGFLLKFVNRGYLYMIHIQIELIDSSKMLVTDFIECRKSRLRNYFRAEADIEFTVKMLSVTGNPGTTVPLSRVGTPDISGGGFFFYSKMELYENTKVYLSLDLEDCGVVETNARVVRCKPLTKRDEVYGIAVEFIGITDKHRERILNFVSGIQRRQLMLGVCAESRQWH